MYSTTKYKQDCTCKQTCNFENTLHLGKRREECSHLNSWPPLTPFNDFECCMYAIACRPIVVVTAESKVQSPEMVSGFLPCGWQKSHSKVTVVLTGYIRKPYKVLRFCFMVSFHINCTYQRYQNHK